MKPHPGSLGRLDELESYTYARGRGRQLWSGAGFLGMIYHGLLGMTFTPHGISIQPVKPAGLFPASISLRNLQYRAATLDIRVSGNGANVVRFEVNGRRRSRFCRATSR